MGVDQDARIADAVRAGRVLEGMTRDQVLSARGAALREEVIPPDAELWHYSEGEVAFSQGRVTYVDLDASQGKPAAPSTPAAADRVTREDLGATAGEPRSPLEIARVHTPGDGFLALRSEPTIRRGKRLLKIPHGSRLKLEGCVSRPGDGRWCSTTFDGRKGWVFERYLVTGTEE